MKFIPLILICILSAASAQAKTISIVLSPLQTTTQAQTQRQQVIKLLVSLDYGDIAHIVDGQRLQTIGTFKVPQSRSYAAPRAKINANRDAVKALMHFAKTAQLKETIAPNTVRIPQVLRYIAKNKTVDSLDIILLARPLYDTPQDPEFSMKDGLFPSDGHLIKTRQDTPFGVKGQAQLLKNVRIHWGLGLEYTFPSDAHAYAIERFWTLFIEAQGGQLATFTADPTSVFTRAQNHATAPHHDHKIQQTDKFGMVRLQRDSGTSIYDRPVSYTPLTQRQQRQAHKLEIGVSWDCTTCDIDIFAQPGTTAKTLYFRQTQTAEGEHIKDFQHSPRATGGFETIRFHQPVHLSDLKLALNFYAGHAPSGVRGEIRLAVAGQTYATPFVLKAKHGNKGVGIFSTLKSGQATSSHSLFIDPLSIVGTRSEL